MIAASDIVKKLRNGQNMRDLMTKTYLVMMAEPEKFVETERGKNPVQFELTTNGLIGLSYDAR
jgi:predicted transcriptional regulator